MMVIRDPETTKRRSEERTEECDHIGFKSQDQQDVLSLKTRKKRRVPHANVTGSNENQENREANTTKKSETGRKERT